MTVTVYGASSDKIAPAYKDAARTLGRLIAGAGGSVVCGGGSAGLMAAVTDGALGAGGWVTGVIPRFMMDKGWDHPGLTEIVVTDGMHSRKAEMLRRADAIVALPGGIGTFDELFEALTWRQLGLWNGPIVLLDTLGYYRRVMELLQQARDDNFLRAGRSSMPDVAATPEEAMTLIANA